MISFCKHYDFNIVCMTYVPWIVSELVLVLQFGSSIAPHINMAKSTESLQRSHFGVPPFDHLHGLEIDPSAQLPSVKIKDDRFVLNKN